MSFALSVASDDVLWIELARSSGFSQSTRRQLTSCLAICSRPLFFSCTTGKPQAIASREGSPKPSYRDEFTNTSDLAYSACISFAFRPNLISIFRFCGKAEVVRSALQSMPDTNVQLSLRFGLLLASKTSACAKVSAPLRK